MEGDGLQEGRGPLPQITIAGLEEINIAIVQGADNTVVMLHEYRGGKGYDLLHTTVDTLVKGQIQLLAIKEGIRLNGAQDLHTRVMVTVFGLFAEIERELISLRTTEALAVASAAGKRLGRPRGTRGRSKLDGKETQIKELLALHVSKASIAKITGVDRATLYHFMRSQRLG